MIVMGLVGCGGSAADEDSLVIRGEECEWRFLPVEGESQLPLTFMRTGEAREKMEFVNLPRFWIAERPVTEREYAFVMGMSVRERCAADQPASDMSWLEAYKFCLRFNEKYGDQLPKGYMLSLPTMIDWAHAVRRLAGKVDRDSVGTFLFQGAVKHGFLATYDGSTIAENPEVDVAIDYNCIAKCWQSVQIGIRPVLIPFNMSYLGVNAWEARVSVLCYQYLLDEAQELIEKARQISPLSQEEFQKIFGNDLNFIQNADYKYNHEDWSGIVSVSARYAEERGYQASQFVYLWMLLNWYDEPFFDDEKWAAFYSKAGIVGTLKSPCELPAEVRPSADTLESYATLDGADTNRLQVLECDFTGDGRTDLVVEGCSVGARGYWYNFCQPKQDGSYTNVLSLQTVGLCAIPPKKGGAVGFIVIEKTGNPFLTSSLLTFDAEGKPSLAPVSSKEFYMLDAEKDSLYRAAPFIGGGLGMGWCILAEHGVWYRPLYWPWEGTPVF